MVESATAESYNFTFVPGTLTVTVATAVDGIETSSARQQRVYYTLDGSRVVGTPRPGVYVVRQNDGTMKKVQIGRK